MDHIWSTQIWRVNQCRLSDCIPALLRQTGVSSARQLSSDSSCFLGGLTQQLLGIGAGLVLKWSCPVSIFSFSLLLFFLNFVTYLRLHWAWANRFGAFSCSLSEICLEFFFGFQEGVRGCRCRSQRNSGKFDSMMSSDFFETESLSFLCSSMRRFGGRLKNLFFLGVCSIQGGYCFISDGSLGGGLSSSTLSLSSPEAGGINKLESGRKMGDGSTSKCISYCGDGCGSQVSLGLCYYYNDSFCGIVLLGNTSLGVGGDYGGFGKCDLLYAIMASGFIIGIFDQQLSQGGRTPSHLNLICSWTNSNKGLLSLLLKRCTRQLASGLEMHSLRFIDSSRWQQFSIDPTSEMICFRRDLSRFVSVFLSTGKYQGNMQFLLRASISATALSCSSKASLSKTTRSSI